MPQYFRFLREWISQSKMKPVRYLVKRILFSLCLLSSSNLFANSIENKFIDEGLIDVNDIDRSIKVDLVNSDPAKNFFEEDFYDGLNKAYLRRRIALMLANAQRMLRKGHPTYSLQVLDAARPRSVSRAMYKKMKGTRFEKYVANPAKGSMHNYGVAVDITIVDATGTKLDMGPSPFYKTHAEIYWQYFLTKIGFSLSTEQQHNRAILKHAMLKAGFHPLSHEWWHFNGMKKEDARNVFSIIE